jgi:hypothetical protein
MLSGISMFLSQFVVSHVHRTTIVSAALLLLLLLLMMLDRMTADRLARVKELRASLNTTNQTRVALPLTHVLWQNQERTSKDIHHYQTHNQQTFQAQSQQQQHQLNGVDQQQHGPNGSGSTATAPPTYSVDSIIGVPLSPSAPAPTTSVPSTDGDTSTPPSSSLLSAPLAAAPPAPAVAATGTGSSSSIPTSDESTSGSVGHQTTSAKAEKGEVLITTPPSSTIPISTLTIPASSSSPTTTGQKDNDQEEDDDAPPPLVSAPAATT